MDMGMTQLFDEEEEEEEPVDMGEPHGEEAQEVASQQEAQEFASQQEAQEQDASQPAAQPETGFENLEDDVEIPPAADEGAQGGVANLFGSDDEEDEQPEEAAGQQDHDRPVSEDAEEERRRRREPILGPPIQVDVPLLPAPVPGSTYVLRTTNIVSVQPQPFDAATFEPEDENAGVEDEWGRHRVRLAHGAVVRWRMVRGADGRHVPHSNARFVRWEDGSLQLLLGDEVLDAAPQDTAANNTYLFCLRGLVQGQGHLAQRLALRPASLESGLHKRLREAVDKRHTSGFKVARTGGLANPEMAQRQREAAEDERIKGREALQRKQEKVMARAYGGGRATKPARLSERYLEEEQEWEAVEDGIGFDDVDDGLTAAQRARLSLARRAQDDDNEAEAGRRLQAAKRGGVAAPAASGRRSRARGRVEEDEELAELDEEDEEEYDLSDSSGGEEAAGAGTGKAAKAPAQAAPTTGGARARRGVVLSDDEE